MISFLSNSQSAYATVVNRVQVASRSVLSLLPLQTNNIAILTDLPGLITKAHLTLDTDLPWCTACFRRIIIRKS